MPIPFTSPEAFPTHAERDGQQYRIFQPSGYVRVCMDDGSWQQVFSRRGAALAVHLAPGETLADRLNDNLPPLLSMEEEIKILKRQEARGW